MAIRKVVEDIQDTRLRLEEELRLKRAGFGKESFGTASEQQRALKSLDAREEIAGLRFYKKFTIKKQPNNFNFWLIFCDDGSPTPQELSCLWTGPEDAKRAIDTYLNTSKK